MDERTGSDLRSARVDAGISLRELEAELRRMDPTGRGLSIATLSRLENGEGEVTSALAGFWARGLRKLGALTV